MSEVVDRGRRRLWSILAHDTARRQLDLARLVLASDCAIIVDEHGEIGARAGERDDLDLRALCAEAVAAGDIVARTVSGQTLALAAPLQIGTQVVLGAIGVSRYDGVAWSAEDRRHLAAVADVLQDLAELGGRILDIEEADAARAAASVDTNHELRTPLQAIVGFTEFLKTETRPHLISAHARTIQAAANAVLTLINRTLDDASLAENGDVDAGPVALRPLAETCLSMVGPAAIEKGLDARLVIAADVPAKARLDRQKVMQALLNLLNNAVKYTDRGEFRLEIARVADGLRFCVSDTGIGIAEDERDRLFQRFSRLGAEERETDGTGLGLAITKSLVETMGGTVGVASTGAGSSFWFDVPLHVEQPVEIASTASASPLRARILLADDLDLNRRLIADMLAIDGHTVDCVCDGAAAVKAVREHTYELVLMDMIMPGMDGLAAARAIRALPGPAARVPIVALTANCADDQLDACLAAGMDATLTKPMTFEGLSTAVARWLGRRDEAA